MTLYARDWSPAPILAGELAPGVWIKGGVISDVDAPSRPWSMVSTVLDWPSTPLPASHPMHGTEPGKRIVAVREALPGVYTLVEVLMDRPGFMVTPDTPTLKLADASAAELRWYALPKMTEFVTLVLTDRVTGRRLLGAWPEPLEDSNSASV